MKRKEPIEIARGSSAERAAPSPSRASATSKSATVRRGVLMAGIAAHLIATAQGQLLFRFDTVAEYAANFREAGISSGNQFVYSFGPGVGGYPGRVEKAFNYAETFLFSSPLIWGTDGNIEFGASFLYNSRDFHPGRAGNELFTIGLLSTDSAGFLNRVGFAYASISVVVAEGGGAFRNLAVISKTEVATSEERTLSSTVSLTSGWYDLRGRWKALLDGNVECEAALLWRGADGTAPAVEVVSLAARHFNPDVALASRFFAGIDGVGLADMLAFDDVWLIPEPSSWALLVLSGGLLFWAVRRRTHWEGAAPSPHSQRRRSH